MCVGGRERERKGTGIWLELSGPDHPFIEQNQAVFLSLSHSLTLYLPLIFFLQMLFLSFSPPLHTQNKIHENTKLTVMANAKSTCLHHSLYNCRP